MGLSFDVDDSYLLKLRITLDKLKHKSDTDYILRNLLSFTTTSLPYLVTEETGKNGNVHWHGVLYTEYPDNIKQLLKENVQSRGFSCNLYDAENNNRCPEYYFGYILKETPPNIIIQGNIEDPEGWAQYYKQQNVKTSDDCLTYVKEHYGIEHYDEHRLLQTIVDYYKDTKKVYDKYIILRRSFHMCRLALFEDIERSHLRDALDKIIEK